MRYALLISLILLAFADVGHADESADNEARAAFKEGVTAFDEGRLSDALVAFERAYSLRPAFKLLYNIGQAQTDLGLTRQAVSTFERYLSEGGDRIEPDRRLAVEAEINRLRVLAGVPKPEPEAAPAIQKVTVSKEIAVVPNPQNNRFMTSVAPWLSTGLAVATLTCGTVFGVRAASLNKSLKANCTDGECPPQYEDDIHTMNGSAIAADVLFISTTVLTATAISLFAISRHKKKGESK